VIARLHRGEGLVHAGDLAAARVAGARAALIVDVGTNLPTPSRARCLSLLAALCPTPHESATLAARALAMRERLRR
jgi:hypothetical protein